MTGKIFKLLIVLIAIGCCFAGACKPAKAVVSGEMFITTQGAGAYKFTGTSIYVFKLKDYNERIKSVSAEMDAAWTNIGTPEECKFQNGESLDDCSAAREEQYSKPFEIVFATTGALLPVATTSTDSDGKFSIELQPGAYIFEAKAPRRVGGRTEITRWAVPARIDKTQTLTLNGNNEYSGSPLLTFPEDAFSVK